MIFLYITTLVLFVLPIDLGLQIDSKNRNITQMG